MNRRSHIIFYIVDSIDPILIINIAATSWAWTASTVSYGSLTDYARIEIAEKGVRYYHRGHDGGARWVGNNEERREERR